MGDHNVVEGLIDAAEAREANLNYHALGVLVIGNGIGDQQS